MTKNLIYIVDFLCQIEILLLNMLKIPDVYQNFSNSKYFLPKLSNPRFFRVKWQP